MSAKDESESLDLTLANLARVADQVTLLIGAAHVLNRMDSTDGGFRYGLAKELVDEAFTVASRSGDIVAGAIECVAMLKKHAVDNEIPAPTTKRTTNRRT